MTIRGMKRQWVAGVVGILVCVGSVQAEGAAPAAVVAPVQPAAVVVPPPAIKPLAQAPAVDPAPAAAPAAKPYVHRAKRTKKTRFRRGHAKGKAHVRKAKAHAHGKHGGRRHASR